MSHKFKRILLSMLIVSLTIGAGGFAAVGSVAADDPCLDPEVAQDECDADEGSYLDMLDSLFELAQMTLQYAGFITVFIGALLWFTARRSSDRAQTGVWLLLGGFVMIIFYFGFSAFVSLLKWIAEGEGAGGGGT